MPSIQHGVLKTTLSTINLTLGRRKGDINYLRDVLEVSTVWLVLPWGVHFREEKVGTLTVKWLLPTGADKDRVLLYFHGGGYSVGSSHTHRALVGQIAKEAGIQALLLEYRKSPEFPFPAAVEDGVIAYKWLLSQGYKPENILIGGDSAGGGLALSTILALKKTQIELPAACIALSPWTDLVSDSPSIHRNANEDPLLDVSEMSKWARYYVGDYPLKHPLASPLYGDYKGFPPLLLQVSDAEILYDDSIRLAETARKKGVEVELQVWKGVIHWWHLFWRVLPEGREAIQKISDFIRQSTRTPAALS